MCTPGAAAKVLETQTDGTAIIAGDVDILQPSKESAHAAMTHNLNVCAVPCCAGTESAPRLL